MYWFLYDNGLRLERVKEGISKRIDFEKQNPAIILIKPRHL